MAYPVNSCLSTPPASGQISSASPDDSHDPHHACLPKKRLAILFQRFGPYHLARLHASAACHEVTGIEYSAADSTYAWDVTYGAESFRRVNIFQNDSIRKIPHATLMASVKRALSEACPDAVAIPGWADRCSLVALLWCILNKIPAVIMSDSPEWIVRRRWWKELLKRRLLCMVSGALVAGETHRDYLLKLGMQSSQIQMGFDVVDNAYFAAGAATARHHREEILQRHQLPRPFFLTCSRFVFKKNVQGLITSYAAYRKEFNSTTPAASGSNNGSPGGSRKPPTKSSSAPAQPWDLVIMGDGELRPKIESQIKALGLEQSVHLPGFQQYQVLPEFYGLAKAFILASASETWGLVVNEAMACGLPVLVSTRCGCSTELVVESRNGHLFHPDHPHILAKQMLSLSTMPNEVLAEMGEASTRIISQWGVDRFATSMQAVVESGLRLGPRAVSRLERALLALLIRCM